VLTRPRTGRRRGGIRRVAAALLTLTASLVGVLGPAGDAAAAPSCGPSYDNQVRETPWPLRRLRPDLAWPLSQGDGITVAVIDSGVSTTHPALDGKVLPGLDVLDPTTNGQCDEAAHGTLVAGIIAARQPPGSAFHGVAPKARILPVRVLRDTQKNLDQTIPAKIAEAIVWGADQGAHVINLSLVTQQTQPLTDAVRYALAKNVVIVAAAGNEGGNGGRGEPAYPAAYDGVLAVAGIDEQDHHVSTSSAGEYVDVAAPGANVEGPMPRGGGYAQFQAGGTSFAAAYVSGLAALIRAYDPTLSPAQVTERITSTADHPPEGRNSQVGYGAINPYRALTSVVGAGPGPGSREGTLNRPERKPDGLATVRTIAVWTAVGAVVLAMVMPLLATTIRRTRHRGRRGRRSRRTGSGPTMARPSGAPAAPTRVVATTPVPSAHRR
jgi:membrane-anchored mycosin MYCP